MYSLVPTSSQPPLSLTCSSSSIPSICINTHIHINPRNQNSRKHTHLSLKCKQSIYSPRIVNPSVNSSDNVARKVQCLIAEFKSLKEPIDRVKTLLHYATLLPFLDESIRSEENRVPGCTAQVWLEVKMDFEGFMRFRVDSDSEITKGFASCLIWLLDRAAPEEVVEVKAEDLAEMNVGILPANSRVNTWNTVLISMQKRTVALVEQRFGDSAKSLAFVSIHKLVITCDAFITCHRAANFEGSVYFSTYTNIGSF